MRTNYKNLWMLAAILTCGLVMTSCVDDKTVPDNPSPTPEQASAKDPGKWWIDENNMDKSVKPGDNFFMYCNGSWWKNTAVDQTFNITTRLSEMKPTFEERVNSLTDANYAIYKSHLKWADPNSEAAASAQKLYDDVLKKSGLAEAKTSADVLRAYGKMCAMGVSSCIKLQPFCYDNKICLYAKFNNEYFVSYEDDLENIGLLATRSGIRPSIRQIINENPDVMAHLVPLCGRSGTRGIPNEWSFLRYVLEGMGIDATQVFIYDDYLKVAELTDGPVSEFSTLFLRQMQTNFENQAAGVDVLKEMIMNYYKTDYGFISQKTMEEYNNNLNKSVGDNITSVTKRWLSLKKLEMSLERDYLSYLRSKMVADQLVPKGLKERYMNYCKDMKDVFAQRIKANDWLSEDGKKNALEKLDAMVFNVAEPNEWYTEGLPDFTKSQSLLEDIYIMRKAYLNLMKALLGKSREEASFTVVITDSNTNLSDQNAFYDRHFNSINMLPGFILPPFFDPAQSLAINYECFCTLGQQVWHHHRPRHLGQPGRQG